MGQAEGRLGQAGDWILDPKRSDLDTLTQVGSAFSGIRYFFPFFFLEAPIYLFLFYFILLL